MRKISGIAVMSGLLALPIAAQAQTGAAGTDRKVVGAKIGVRSVARSGVRHTLGLVAAKAVAGPVKPALTV